MIDSDSERKVSFRCSLILGGGGVAGRSRWFGEGGGLGSFLCVLSGVLGRMDGLVVVVEVLGAGVGERRADAAEAGTVLVGVWWEPGSDIPRPESGVPDTATGG